MNNVIELVTFTITTDEIGQQVRHPQIREVFAEKMPIRMNEHFTAGQQGIKPEAAYRVWAIEYDNEGTLISDGKTYRIYRVFRDTKQRVELYCEAVLHGN